MIPSMNVLSTHMNVRNVLPALLNRMLCLGTRGLCHQRLPLQTHMVLLRQPCFRKETMLRPLGKTSFRPIRQCIPLLDHINFRWAQGGQKSVMKR